MKRHTAHSEGIDDSLQDKILSIQGGVMRTRLGGLIVMVCTMFSGAGCAEMLAVPAPEKSSTAVVVRPESAQIKALLERTSKQLVFLPGGTFEMGDWGNEDGLPYDAFSDGNSRPVHRVTLDGFSMMAYKVSYEDFDLFTDSVGEQRVNMDRHGLKFRAPRKPAGVNWYGAKAYCQWLGKLTGLPFDLATEAQWEYAARSGGKKLLFATDNGMINKERNYPNSWKVKDDATPEIGSYPPNPAGLYGMLDYSANEWVNDWYDPDYYLHSPALNPKGPVEGKPVWATHPEFGPAKVVRGHTSPGNNPAFGGFVFSRKGKTPTETRPDFKNNFTGYSYWSAEQFRCVVNADHVSK